MVDIWSPAADPVTADSPRDAAPQCEFKTQCPHHDGARVQRLILRILEKRRHRCGRRHRLPGRSCRPVHHSGGRVVVEHIHRIAHGPSMRSSHGRLIWAVTTSPFLRRTLDSWATMRSFLRHARKSGGGDSATGPVIFGVVMSGPYRVAPRRASARQVPARSRGMCTS